MLGSVVLLLKTREWIFIILRIKSQIHTKFHKSLHSISYLLHLSPQAPATISSSLFLNPPSTYNLTLGLSTYSSPPGVLP